MNLADYFDPSDSLPASQGLPRSASLYGRIQKLAESKGLLFDSNTLAIIGVNENRNSNNPGANQAPDAIRPFLYSLSASGIKKSIVDLGNLKITPNPSDTYMALRDVVAHLVSCGSTCLVLGGTQELTWPLYLAVSESEPAVNISIIDQAVDMGYNDGDFSSTCFIDKILTDSRQNLSTLNVIGYQGYYVDGKKLDELSHKNFEIARLGFVRGAMAEVEPTLRDSHIVSLDMGSIKQSDSPGSIYPSPNGFYSEEVCQLARYSGVSCNARVFGLFELNTIADKASQSASLAAQIAWHFMDGFSSRSMHQSPSVDQQSMKKFYVKSPIPNIELVFLHNTLNDTWWFQLPATQKTNGIFSLIACSYNDYQKASNGDVPDRWLRAWRRIS